MANVLVTTYLEFDIFIDTYYGNFTADGIDEPYPSLTLMKEKIDKESKVKYKPLDGFILINGVVADVLITRPRSSRYSVSNTSFWVSHKAQKKRETTNSVYLDTPDTRALLKQYKETLSERNKLDAECKEILAKMKSIEINLTKI